MIKKKYARAAWLGGMVLSLLVWSPQLVQAQTTQTNKGYDARLDRFLAEARLGSTPASSADFIVALVNSDIVTNQELKSRYQRAVKQLPGGKVPDEQAAAFLRNLLDDLIFERLQLQAAQDAGITVDARTLDNAVATVARQNEVSMEDLKTRLKKDGVSFDEFQQRLRAQILLQRVRERYTDGRGRISDYELESQLNRLQVGRSTPVVQINLAHILIPVPEGANAEMQASLLVKAQAIAAKAAAGANFEALAREVGSAAGAGEAAGMGLKPDDRYPSLFADLAKTLVPGRVGAPLRSGAGFHILKMLDKQSPISSDIQVNETRARHILIRALTPQAQEQAKVQLNQWAAELRAGKSTFAELARQNSEDGSAQEGGDLGWASPAQFVPEFEKAMNALAVDEVSEPIVSRFGVHLIQVQERRLAMVSRAQLRERIAGQIREQRAEDAYKAWAKELREKAYLEFREPPQL